MTFGYESPSTEFFEIPPKLDPIGFSRPLIPDLLPEPIRPLLFQDSHKSMLDGEHDAILGNMPRTDTSDQKSYDVGYSIGSSIIRKLY